jgi:2-polyprenyl-3-methyl-5-hydroxy-6-metoxy-1,4-benzoquinol methylase|tara:strand:+ start:228 stop:878 length:651 start_codon:yes stop_codon:yes gene_type:complete
MNHKIEERFQNVSKSKTFGNIVHLFNLNKKAVLDAGCSYGEFLIHFGDGSEGITLDKAEAEYTRSKGLSVHLDNVESQTLKLNKTFDVVFANNLLEHLYSPHEFLIKTKEYLKPDGTLILGVPCIPTITPLIQIKKFRGSMAGGHINFFTRRTLIETVKRAGWKIQTVRGFHFRNPVIDLPLNPIYPHFYVIATPDPNFEYPEKRKKELAGYKNTS